MFDRLPASYQTLIRDLAQDPDVVKLAALSPMDLAMSQHGYAACASRIDRFADMLHGHGWTTDSRRVMSAETLRIAGMDSRGIDAAMGSLFCIDAYRPALA